MEDIENLSDAEIGSMDPVEVAFGNETIWFTQTHIAEIRELRALQEAVDKYKDSACLLYTSRHATDATYIAQLLGRMIRTPMQMHIPVSYTHLCVLADMPVKSIAQIDT